MLEWLAGAADPLLSQAPRVAADLLSRAVITIPTGSAQFGLFASRLADALFRIGSLRMAEWRADQGRPAYVYQFDWQSPAGFESCHCLEIPFVFNNFASWTDSPMLKGANPALTKGLAIATAVLAAVSLFRSFIDEAHLGSIGVQINMPTVFVGLMIYFRRRQQVGTESESAIATMTARDFESQLSGGRSRARGFADADDSDAEVATDEREQPTFAAVSATARREPPTVARISEDTLSSETAIHVDQQDALAEADFHMAYGLYDQAADIVKLAIDRQPERRDLALKLAEIYFVWGNKDLFLETAKRLHDTVDEAPAGEWDKIAIMGKQICPGEALFAGDIGRSFAAESVDVNLEGGEHHVDIDLFEAPEGDQPKSDMDFELANTGAHSIQGDSGLDFLLDEPQRGVDDEPTREMDTNARTQETPTIESPYLADLPDEGSQTIREQFDTGAFSNDERNADQTSEIALDEIGLNVDELETTGTVENSFGETAIGDDELTRLAKRTDFSSYERTVEAPHGEETKTMLAPHMDQYDDNFDSEDKESNTITVEQVDFDAATGEHQLEDISATGMFKPTQKIDIDLDRFDLNVEDTVEQRRPSDTGLFRATQKIDVDLDHLADPSFGLHEGENSKNNDRTG